MSTTFGSLDDLEGWLSVFNDKLTHMREDISAIEETNLRLERQATNHQRLVDLLKGLMGQMQVGLALAFPCVLLGKLTRTEHLKTRGGRYKTMNISFRRTLFYNILFTYTKTTHEYIRKGI